MNGLLSQRFEEGVQHINEGIGKKGGTKRLQQTMERDSKDNEHAESRNYHHEKYYLSDHKNPPMFNTKSESIKDISVIELQTGSLLS